MAEKKERKGGRKPFYDQTITVDHVCKKCGHTEKLTKRVWSEKEVVTPATPAEMVIHTHVETVATLNDFTDKEMKKKSDKKES